ncbi:hypothetical protein PIB30_030420 [Stylosanthes scabra]|uniref:C3H1-type domain-containing protein n=1 Tax=Stylosanthes scabra TaxID=79078 RepID=A0ABU6ZAQ7_9FABA|nr:hypothetical protein [Stylosanthes scabra]
MEKEPEFSEFVGSDFIHHKDAVPEKRIQEFDETVEGTGDKDRECVVNDIVLGDIEETMGIEEVEDASRTLLEDRCNDADKEQQRIMDELELAVNGTQNIVCDGGVISLGAVSGEKQNDSRVVELVDYRLENDEFLHSDVKKCGNAGEMQVQGSRDQILSTSTQEQTSALVTSTSNINHENEMKMVCAAMDSLPNSKGEVGKVEQCYSMVAQALHVSSDNITSETLNICEDERLLDYDNLEDKCEMKNERNLEKSTCAKNPSISSNILIENEDLEEGELVGDIGVDPNSFGIPSTDSFIPQMKINENMGNAEKEGLDKQIGSKPVTDLPINYVQNQVLHKRKLEDDSDHDHGNPVASKKADVSCKKKRGPGSAEKKAKKKKKQRKKRAEKNKQLGVKRLKLPLVQQKPKTINYCRHFLVGRCYEGDKCQFSHDTVPSTKSSPCSFFARHSCMKGDDCPFDHQLSKYPCDNFVSRGFCARGDACLFSHKLPAKEDIRTPSKDCKPGMKSPHFSGNTNFNMPPNINGYSSIQQNHLINSPRVLSQINLEHKVTNTLQKQPKLASKGVSFIDVAKLSSPAPTTPKEGMTKVGSSYADQSTSGTNQTSVEIPKKLSARVPKGINFLAFGKDPVNSFKSSFKSLVNAENGIDVLPNINFSLLDHNNSSIKVDDGSKAIDGTKGGVPKTDLVSGETFEKNKSVAESIKLSFPGKASMTDTSTGLQGIPRVNDNESKPVGEAKGATDLFQTSASTPFMRLVSPLSSEQLPSRKELMSTLLSFASGHELVIKKKDSAGTSTA